MGMQPQSSYARCWLQQLCAMPQVICALPHLWMSQGPCSARDMVIMFSEVLAL